MNDFETWWHNEGSDPKRFNEDWEEHCKRMCQIAWSNGAFMENEACAKVCDELHWPWHMGDNSGPKECAATIRARNEREL